ncbi:threonine-phosphate decarboxylase [Metabacillus sp. JX24]|uniref:threonine-phosphate decarboxylase n=1 Tax=Metabacillus sp. JX24 TaxID=3240759 RepID=UPI003510A069
MWPQHGGNSSAIQNLLTMKGIEAGSNMLDFSANLNPLGIPDTVLLSMQKSLLKSTVYPDPAYIEERGILAAFEGVKMENIWLTNGGAEAIFLVAQLFKRKRAGIFQPAFSEYERACRIHQLHINHCSYEDLKDSEAIETDLFFLCRPNNPTGEMLPEEKIVRLLETAKQAGQYIVVDEAFVHFSDSSLAHLLGAFPNLILLRSLTKIFAIPGIRFGYVLAQEHIIRKLASLSVPWSVNSAALSVIHALPETKDFLIAAKEWLREEWQFLRGELLEIKFQVSDTEVNFYLLRDPLLQDHEPLLLFLAGEGILARHTVNFPLIEGSALRLAVRTREENMILLKALRKWRNTAC